MSLYKRLRRFNKLAWLSLLLTATALVIGLMQLQSPETQVSIVSGNQTNVLDIHQPLRDLTISFRGKDIQEENLNLQILTLRVENTGKVNILQSYYDQNDVWGFGVTTGEIIEVRLANSNSDYIVSHLNPLLNKTTNVVELQKIIFERGDFFTIEMLVLHRKSTPPQVIPLGKIAGIGNMSVTSVFVNQKEGFLDQLIQGNALVHLVRFVLYIVILTAGGLVIVLVASVIDTTVGANRKAKRRRIIKEIIPENESLGEKAKTVINAYVDEGLTGLKRMKGLVEDEGEIIRIRDLDAYRDKKSLDALVLREHDPKLRNELVESYSRTELLKQLVESGFVTFELGNKVSVDNQAKEFLDRTIGRLERQ